MKVRNQIGLSDGYVHMKFDKAIISDKDQQVRAATSFAALRTALAALLGIKHLLTF